MKRLLEYLHLKDIGVYEMIFAFSPILFGYSYSFPLFAPLLVILAVWGLFRSKKRVYFDKALVFLFIYVVLHEFYLSISLLHIPSYFNNNFLSYIIVLSAIPFICTALNYQKVVGCLNMVACFCMIGLIYQYILILAGIEVHPIKLPFMPEMNVESRLYQVVSRPTSFFWEPQSFCSFMLIPQAIAIVERKFSWAIIITIAMLLSGSTTGILTSIILLLVYLSDRKVSKKIRLRLFLVVTIITLFFSYSSLFDAGRTKMENVNYDTSSRLSNGPILVSHMPVSDMIFGGTTASVPDYYFEGQATGAVLIEKSGSIYISTFWWFIVKFGLIGLILYLLVYIKPIVKDKAIRIYILPLLATLFSNPDGIGPYFAFEFIFIYNYLLNKKNNESSNINYTICQ